MELLFCPFIIKAQSCSLGVQVLTCFPVEAGKDKPALRWLLAAVFGIEDPNLHLGSVGMLLRP
jgi:hypothetical protein